MRRLATYKLVALALFLTGTLGFASGCQEEVRRTQNDWIGSQYRPAPMREQEEPGLGEQLGDGMRGTGDFLFGWTGLTGNRQRSRVGDVNVIELDEGHNYGSRQPARDEE